MGFFSALRLAMLGLLVVLLLTPSAGMSLIKKLIFPAAGLWLIAVAYLRKNENSR